TLVDLGALGGHDSQAFGINNSGQIVGSLINAQGRERAAFWSNSTSLPVDLGTAYGDNSEARGINDSGQIVGYSYYVSEGYQEYLHATFWDGSGNPPWDLGAFDFFEALNSAAYDINNNGQIVGFAEGYAAQGD